MATVLVDLQDVLSIAEIVVLIERGYEWLKEPIPRHVENLFRRWNIGLSLGWRWFYGQVAAKPTRKCRVSASASPGAPRGAV